MMIPIALSIVVGCHVRDGINTLEEAKGLPSVQDKACAKPKLKYLVCIQHKVKLASTDDISLQTSTYI
jgi:hypothetical protein